MPNKPPPPVKQPGLDNRDAQLIFDAVWADLEKEIGRPDLVFPHEIIWLGGAPGAGKGTQTPFILKSRDITAPPIVVSDLLNTPQAIAIKNSGRMVGDREVVDILFHTLLDPQFRDGVVVDGFPRTKVQVECLKMFFHKLLQLHAEFQSTPEAFNFRHPLFRIVLLFVSEEVSVERQLKRGRQIREHNRIVRQSGIGELQEERVTDLDSDLCHRRYQMFKESTFEALQSLRLIFHFHFVDAEAPIEQVEKNIEKEFSYQSSLELEAKTFELIRNIPIVSELTLRARQELVERLENYSANHREQLESAIGFIDRELIPIIRTHAISGIARINSRDPLLDDPLVIRMIIDVLTERGYHVTVDAETQHIPARMDPETHEITCNEQRVYRIQAQFSRPEIRRGIS